MARRKRFTLRDTSSNKTYKFDNSQTMKALKKKFHDNRKKENR